MTNPEVKLAVENGDIDATLRKLADIVRAELAILGEDYVATFTPYLDEGMIGVKCEKRYDLILRQARGSE